MGGDRPARVEVATPPRPVAGAREETTVNEQTVTLTLTEHTMLVQQVENLTRQLASCREQRAAIQRQLTLALEALPEEEEAENGLL